MKDTDRILRQHLGKESNELLFSNIELGDRVKQSIRQQAAAARSRRIVFPKAWLMATVTVAAGMMRVLGLPVLEQPKAPAPADHADGHPPLPPLNGDIAGSGLSQSVTTPIQSVEEAKAAFGEHLLVPNAVPEGFALAEIVTVGMPNEPVRDDMLT